jgi:tetratricopeptide (TPR) repeat protein
VAQAHRRGRDCRLELTRVHNNLGALRMQQGRPEEGLADFRRALELRRQLLTELPGEGLYRYEVALAHGNLGAALGNLKRHAEAVAEYRRAADQLAALGKEFPDVPAYRADRATQLTNLGISLRVLGRPREAVAVLREALAAREQLAASPSAPREPRYQLVLALNSLTCLLHFLRPFGLVSKCAG